MGVNFDKVFPGKLGKALSEFNSGAREYLSGDLVAVLASYKTIKNFKVQDSKEHGRMLVHPVTGAVSSCDKYFGALIHLTVFIIVKDSSMNNKSNVLKIGKLVIEARNKYNVEISFNVKSNDFIKTLKGRLTVYQTINFSKPNGFSLLKKN